MERNTKFRPENSEHAFNQVISVRPDGSRDVGTPNDKPTRTQQQFAEECDVNNIVKKYERTGEFTHVSKKIGRYMDLSEIPDYQTMIHQIHEAEDAFMQLPAKTRLRFNNDPGQLMSFLKDPTNYDEGVKLGLLDKRPDEPVINEQNLKPNDKKGESTT